MDLGLVRLLAAAAAAATVAAAVVAVCVRGGPRRRPPITLGAVGGRVRLPARSLERMAFVAVAIAVVTLVMAARASSTLVVAVWWTGLALFVAARRGGFEALLANEDSVEEDDGYVDAEGGRGLDG